MKLHFTGERMIPEINKNDLIYLEHVSRYFFSSQFVKGKNVLDISSGSGYGSYYLKKCGAKKVIGVDISSEAIEYAKKKYPLNGVRFLQGDAEEIPFKENFFEVVVSLETIEHLNDPEKFLKEVKRVLTKDGILIVSTPNAHIHPKGSKFHTKEFTPIELDKTVKKYFKNFTLLYQNNFQSNLILPRATFNRKQINFEFPETIIKSAAATATDFNSCMFLVGIASDREIPKAVGNVMFTNTEESTVFKKRIKNLEKHIAAKELEITKIYNSRGWKLLTSLHLIKTRIPIINKI